MQRSVILETCRIIRKVGNLNICFPDANVYECRNNVMSYKKWKKINFTFCICMEIRVGGRADKNRIPPIGTKSMLLFPIMLDLNFISLLRLVRYRMTLRLYKKSIICKFFTINLRLVDSFFLKIKIAGSTIRISSIFFFC